MNLVFNLEDESIGDEINRNVYLDLLGRGVIESTPEEIYTFKKYHPTESLVVFVFKIGKTPNYDESILKYVNQSDLIELDDTWRTEIS